MPKPAITRVPNLAITPVSTNKNNGLYAPRLTDTQRDAIPAATLANGAIIYNTTSNAFQIYQAGAWVALNTTPATNPITIPSFANDGAIAIPAAGMIYYNTTNNVVRSYQNGTWLTLYSSTNDLGFLVVPIVANNATLPGAPAAGMIVYQTDVNQFKCYQNGNWAVMYNTNSTATGIGLNAGDSPFTLGQGTRGTVEVAANEINGFMYYDSTNNVIRARVNGGWGTVTVV